MLEIINNLSPFFEDCYARVGVREYGRKIKVSAPTASKMLFGFEKEGLLKREEDRNYIFFHANKESRTFIDLSRIYWKIKLNDIAEEIKKNIVNPAIILFGSLSKAEAKQDSDVDIAVFAHKKTIDFSLFEKKLKRKIQVFWFNSLKNIGNKELANNILNGCVLEGRFRIYGLD